MKKITPDRSYFFRNFPDPSEIKTKEEVARYNALMERVNILYKYGSLSEDITDNLEDTDFFMDNGIDDRSFEEIVEEKMYEWDDFPEEDLKNGDVSAIDFLDDSKIPLNLSIEDLVINSRGTTESISDAGYVLPDGTLLDFGRSGSGIDHRDLAIPIKELNVVGTELMNAFMNQTGAIRIDGIKGTLSMLTYPTQAQMFVIKKIVQKNYKDFHIDMYKNDMNEHDYISSPMAVDMVSEKIDGFYDKQRFYEQKIRKFVREILLEQLSTS